MNNKLTIKRITIISVLTAVAMTIFMLESMIPPFVAIPGIKLGLANIITLFALVTLCPRDAFIILILRVFLGSVFSGQIMTIAYSMTGGILCLITEAFLLKFLPLKNLWAVSVIGAVMHNIGQIGVACLITSSLSIAMYLPYLVISGIITGAFTGLCVQLCIQKSGDKIKKMIR